MRSSGRQSQWWIASVVAASCSLALVVANRPSSSDEPQTPHRVSAVALLPEQSTDALPPGLLGEAVPAPASTVPPPVPVSAALEATGAPGELPATLASGELPATP